MTIKALLIGVTLPLISIPSLLSAREWDAARMTKLMAVVDDQSGKYQLKQRIAALVQMAEDDSIEATKVLKRLHGVWKNTGLSQDQEGKHLYYALGELIHLRGQNMLADSQ